MKSSLILALAFFIVCLTVGAHAADAQQSQPKSTSPTADCPMHEQHSHEMDKRGEQAMGFSQTKTTHHFLLTSDGGTIQVETNDAKDAASRDQIRQHLAHIARMFADGNFETPMFVHDEVPSGVPVMQRLKSAIKYQFEETKQGGQVRITSSAREAVAAVHEFLRFQIEEHHTGDPLEAGQRF